MLFVHRPVQKQLVSLLAGRKMHKHGAGLPLEIIAKVEPFHQKLSEDGLVWKCLHGKAQNQDKNFNGLVWRKIPKEVYDGKDMLELGFFDAVSHFNIGSQSVLQLCEAHYGHIQSKGVKLLVRIVHMLPTIRKRQQRRKGKCSERTRKTRLKKCGSRRTYIRELETFNWTSEQFGILY